VGVLVFGPVVMALYNDPLQLYHKSVKKPLVFSTGMRRQAAGLINNYDFTSIISGTSMAQNFSAREASALFGENFVNLSMAGSRFVERAHSLNKALESDKARIVIYSLDFRYGVDGDEYNAVYPPENYAYLYDKNPINDLQVYAEIEYARCIIDIDTKCPGQWKSDLESLTEWYSKKKHNRRFGGLNQWFKAKNNRQIIAALAEIAKNSAAVRSGTIMSISAKKAKANKNKAMNGFDSHVLKYAAEYPDSRFYLFFPPYSRMKYALWNQYSPHVFSAYLDYISHIVTASSAYSNIKIFGFDDAVFPDDIKNYKDLRHYHTNINSRMLQWISEGQHQITASNLNRYIEKIMRLAENYDVEQIGARVRRYVEQMGKS